MEYTVNPEVVINLAGSANSCPFTTRESFLAMSLQEGTLDQGEYTYLAERYADVMESLIEVANRDGIEAVNKGVQGDMKVYWMETRRAQNTGIEVSM